MNVTFIDPCNYANYSAPTLNNVTLFYMGPTFNFAWPAFQDNISISLNENEYCGVWTYEWAP